ncbi:MAG: IS256 family transposase [Actinomycetota bacterium]|nr:IS256 family transposase [Actinomycetota bacterium]
MADTLSMELLELLRKGEVEDKAGFLGEAVRRLAQAVIETELEQVIGAGRYERSEARTNQRNGSVPRRWDTPVGTMELAIPKLRQGSFFPTLLERRRRVDQALVNVVVEAYVNGVSTRKVDNLVQALGVQGMDKSTVSRLAKELDEQVQEFRERPLGVYPYVWLDATFPKVREGGRVRQMALMIAIGVNDQGERHILGLAIGASENGADWLEFLESLNRRGLASVQLVISDNHFGLRSAVERSFLGASWQRCTVHFTRNAVQKVPKASQTAVSALVRQIFAQPDRVSADVQLERVATNLAKRFPEVSKMLYEAQQDSASACQ